MFNTIYKKFLHTVSEYNLITKDTHKIIISTSGGKDANIMTELLYRYREEYRQDLKLVLANAAMPTWKYNPDKFLDKVSAEQKKILLGEKSYIEEHKKYWEERNIKTVYLDYYQKDGDMDIFNSSGPCNLCFTSQKQAIYHYLEEIEETDGVALAVGLTKWDAIYMVLYHILRSNGLSWEELKERDPARYRLECMHFATFSPYPKINIGIPNKNISTILPIIEISDMETKAFAEELSLPIIPDVCVDLFGEKFCSDKRFFDNFLKVTAKEEISLAKNKMNNLLESELNPLFSNYEDIIKLAKLTKILPPIEEFDGILYDTYMSGGMSAAVDDK